MEDVNLRVIKFDKTERKNKKPRMKKKKRIKKTAEELEKEQLELVQFKMGVRDNRDFDVINGELQYEIAKNQMEENERMETDVLKIESELNNENENLQFKQRYRFYCKIGNMHSFIINKKGKPLLMIGSNWKLPLFIDIIGFIIVVCLYIYWSKYISWDWVIGVVLLGLFELSFLFTFLVEPGLPESFEVKNILEEDMKFCFDCNLWFYKEKDIHHCDECGICVENLAFHFWGINKCVGYKNKISFYILMVLALAQIGYLKRRLTSIN